MAEDLNAIKQKIEEAHNLGILNDDEYLIKMSQIEAADKQVSDNTPEEVLTEGEAKPVEEDAQSFEIEKITPVPNEEPPKKTIKEAAEDDGIFYFGPIPGEESLDSIEFVEKESTGGGTSTFKAPNISVSKSKKGKSKAIIIVAAIVVLGIIGAVFLHNAGGSDYTDEEKPVDIQWSEMKLGSLLPEPPVSTGTVSKNEANELSVDLFPMDKDAIYAYMDKCINEYFTIDVYNPYDSGSNREAFNEDGYKLSIKEYGTNDDKLSIWIEPPVEIGAISWPKKGIGGDLPKPKSDVGKIEYETSDTFNAYVGDTTEKAFSEYVDECLDEGYSIDYEKDDRYFYAENKRGDYLTIDYYGNGIMYIEVFNWDLD